MVGNGDEGGEVGWSHIAEEPAGGVFSFRRHPGRGCGAAVGERDEGGPPVAWVRSPLHQPLVLEGVDKSRYMTGRASQCLAHLTLHQGSTLVQHQEDLSAGGGEPAFSKTPRHLLTEPDHKLEELVNCCHGISHG